MVACIERFKSFLLLGLLILALACGLDIGIMYRIITNASIALNQLSGYAKFPLLVVFGLDLVIFVGFSLFSLSLFNGIIFHLYLQRKNHFQICFLLQFCQQSMSCGTVWFDRILFSLVHRMPISQLPISGR